MVHNKNKNTHQPDSIAVIGIGCYLPGGVQSPDDFWNLLINKKDAIIDVPGDRWDKRRFYDLNPKKAGKTYIAKGGFLKQDISEFDPIFFGLSPREVPTIDPQQRLLLEVTYNAFEDAGIQVETLAGKDVGVFIGEFFLDYKVIQLSPLNREMINTHSAFGMTATILSNRISYTFDFKGPSISIDTACSSSLVAIHYACQSLKNSESSIAIAGGVHIMLRPEPFIALSKGSFLSKHGRCKTFDETATGYVRSEGAAVVILKPYDQAIKDHDQIYAVIKATGVNHDGRTPGISMPNPSAQEALIRKVYSSAHIKPQDIDYIEAHGTGTQAGDSAEASALNAVLSEGRKKDDKVFVGSVKSNIGHSEAIAGIAGFIKATLSLKNGKIPPNLHFNNPNPKLGYEDLCLKVPTEIQTFPGNKNSMVSVNSFGYGGTNAHIVLQQVDNNIPSDDKSGSLEPNQSFSSDDLFIFPVSARTDKALYEQAARLGSFIKESKNSLDDILYTSIYRKSHHQDRGAVIAGSREQLIERLEAFGRGDILEGIVVGARNNQEKSGIVFIYTGMGPQWWAMGRELYHSVPVFKEKVDACDKIFTKIAHWSIRDEMMRDEKSSGMAETQVAQPANFVIQTALTELWKSLGITPDAIVGHSVGEVSAAYESGALTFEDAILVSYHRGRLQQKIAGQGKLLAVGIPEAEALEYCSHYDKISIAAINSPHSVTLSGAEEILLKIGKDLEEKNIFNRMLQVEIPYHSTYMDPIKDELFEVLKDIQPRKAEIPLYSTVTTCRMDGSEYSAEYWWKNVREPVRFAETFKTIIVDEFTLFLEVGPHPVLRNSCLECLNMEGKEGTILSSLNRKKPELFNLYENLGYLYTLGQSINWEKFSSSGAFIKTPGYAWQRERYPWNESEISIMDRLGITDGHIFCNTKVLSPSPAYEVELNDQFFPFLPDHQVQHMVVLPGAAYVEAGLALFYQEMGEDIPCSLENLEFRNMLTIDEDKVKRLHIKFEPNERKYSVFSRIVEDNCEWVEHARGRILSSPLTHQVKGESIRSIKERCPQEILSGQFYDKLDRAGLQYRTHFQGVKEIYVGENEAIARIEGHESMDNLTDTFLLHPTILDSGIQTFSVFIDKLVVPVKIRRINYYSSPGRGCWSYFKMIHITEDSILGELHLIDEEGNVFAELQGLECRRVSKDDKAYEHLLNSCFYQIKWDATDIPESGESYNKWLIFGNNDEIANRVIKDLESRNVDCIRIMCSEKYNIISENSYEVSPDNQEDIKNVINHICENNSIEHIVYLWSTSTETDNNVQLEDVVHTCMPLVYLVKALAKVVVQLKMRLSIITSMAQDVTEEDTIGDIKASPLWGLGQLISNEQPHIICKMIDLDHITLKEGISVISTELLSENSDEDVAFRAGKRFIKRLESITYDDDDDGSTDLQSVMTDTPLELTTGSMRTIESLSFCDTDIQTLGDSEIEVQVSYAFINEQDEARFTGRLSSDYKIGNECCGIVKKIGKNVSNFKIGDEVVVATTEGSFKSFITTDASFAMLKPEGMNENETGFLVPYMIAIRGLIDIASIQAGDKILIHEAATGIGIAAVFLAKWKKAEIFATAQNPAQREFLKSIGIENVLDSGTLEFNRIIFKKTNGYGVDIVFSPLSGEFFRQSFALLAPGGFYLMTGKKAILDNMDLSMFLFDKNISCSYMDMSLMLMQSPDICARLVKEVYKGFSDRYLTVLPVHKFPVNKIVDAYNYWKKNEECIGRVAIAFKNEKVDIPVKHSNSVITSQATYIITGGTKGLGLQIGKWLASKGADHLVLVSRSGAKSDEAKEVIAEIEAKGTKVLALPVDVASEKEIQALIERVKKEFPPIHGIFHGAVVLDDGLLTEMNQERFTKVMMPKVAGLLNLHNATRDLSLDFFVLFSSIASLVGNPGQANYIAANSFFDAFSYMRNSQGLTTTTVNLGVLSEVGVASRDENVKALLANSGLRGFTTEEVLKGIEIIIKEKPVQVGFFDVDWKVWVRRNPRVSQSSKFKSFIDPEDSGPKISDQLREILGQMFDMEKQGKQKHIETLISKELAAVLRLPVDRLRINRPLMEQGVDSLLITELKNRLFNVFGLVLPETTFFNYPTIEKLAGFLFETITELEESDSENNETDDDLNELNNLLKEIDDKTVVFK